jgi:hypothetical protein
VSNIFACIKKLYQPNIEIRLIIFGVGKTGLKQVLGIWHNAVLLYIMAKEKL